MTNMTWGDVRVGDVFLEHYLDELIYVIRIDRERYSGTPTHVKPIYVKILNVSIGEMFEWSHYPGTRVYLCAVTTSFLG